MIQGLGGVFLEFEERSAGLFFSFFFNADEFKIADTDLDRRDVPYMNFLTLFYWL